MTQKRWGGALSGTMQQRSSSPSFDQRWAVTLLVGFLLGPINDVAEAACGRHPRYPLQQALPRVQVGLWLWRMPPGSDPSQVQQPEVREEVEKGRQGPQDPHGLVIWGGR